jgi:hypothetical protein
MIKINLLPVGKAAPAAKVLNQLLVGLLCILAVLGGIGYFYYTLDDEIRRTDAEVKVTEKEIANRAEISKTQEELKLKAETLDKQLNAINNLIGGRDFFIRVLDKITESIPTNELWVSNIKWGGADPKGGGGGISVRGSAYDQDSIVHYMGNLNIIPCDDDKEDSMSMEACITQNNISADDVAKCKCKEMAWVSKEELAKCNANDDICELVNKYKAEVCIERNRECRLDVGGGKVVPDFVRCRDHYKKYAKDSAECADKVKLAKSTADSACGKGAAAAEGAGKDAAETKDKKNSKECSEAEKEYADKVEYCGRVAKYNAKLHEEEYIKYDSVALKSIKLSPTKDGAVYNFDLTLAPAGGAAAATASK